MQYLFRHLHNGQDAYARFATASPSSSASLSGACSSKNGIFWELGKGGGLAFILSLYIHSNRGLANESGFSTWSYLGSVPTIDFGASELGDIGKNGRTPKDTSSGKTYFCSKILFFWGYSILRVEKFWKPVKHKCPCCKWRWLTVWINTICFLTSFGGYDICLSPTKICWIWWLIMRMPLPWKYVAQVVCYTPSILDRIQNKMTCLSGQNIQLYFHI